MLKCVDVMNRDPFTCLPADPIAKVTEIMLRNDLGPVLILESEQTRRIAGIVSNRDLAIKVIGGGRDPRTTAAQEVMTRMVVTVKADDTVDKALEIMRSFQIRRLPVVDRDDRFIGIISQSDAAAGVEESLRVVALVQAAQHSSYLAKRDPIAAPRA